MLLLLTPFFFAFILVFLAVGSWAVARVPFGFRHTGPDFKHGGKVLLLSALFFVLSFHFIGRGLLDQYRATVLYHELTRFMLETVAERDSGVAQRLRTGKLNKRDTIEQLYGVRWQAGLEAGDNQDWQAYAVANAAVLVFIRDQHQWKECNALLLNGKVQPQTHFVGGVTSRSSEKKEQAQTYREALVERVLAIERLRENINPEVEALALPLLPPLQTIAAISAVVLDQKQFNRWDLRSYVRLQMGHILDAEETRRACLWGVAFHEEVATRSPRVIASALKQSIHFAFPD